MNGYLLLAVLNQVIASFAQILLKISAGKTYSSRIREYLNGLVITGYLMLGISMLLGVICYNTQQSGLSYMQVVIMEPLGYIFVMFLSRLFFREKITKRKILGMTILIAGILVFYLC